jgi:hypothetical protein
MKNATKHERKQEAVETDSAFWTHREFAQEGEGPRQRQENEEGNLNKGGVVLLQLLLVVSLRSDKIVEAWRITLEGLH